MIDLGSAVLAVHDIREPAKQTHRYKIPHSCSGRHIAHCYCKLMVLHQNNKEFYVYQWTVIQHFIWTPKVLSYCTHLLIHTSAFIKFSIHTPIDASGTICILAKDTLMCKPGIKSPDNLLYLLNNSQPNINSSKVHHNGFHTCTLALNCSRCLKGVYEGHISDTYSQY